jgi:ATP-dependent Zn protease
MISDSQHTAFHEAGHAVIGRVLSRMPCGLVTIKPIEQELAGKAISAGPDELITHWWDVGKLHREMRSAMCDRIMTYMAGAEAEIVILGRCNGGDSYDRRQIGLLARDSSDFTLLEFFDRYEPRMRRQTRRLVRHHRDKIERVAKALLERETLQPDEVKALMA